ncbi:MAG: hypothetical protein EOO27_49825 [Comamonadaceae bacterium]|nr:MAG: hypothetical protein EOO27_49825 [Comamonadaceae bacterium]
MKNFIASSSAVKPAGKAPGAAQAVGAGAGPTQTVASRYAAPASVLRLNRLYAVAVSINEAIVHVTGEQDLFDRACSVAVDEGGLAMA